MSRTLPDCPSCGGFYFSPGGSTISSSMLNANHTCAAKGCDMHVWELSTGAGHVVLFLNKDDNAQSQIANDWVNKVLLVTWRDRKSKLAAFHEVEWQAWLDEVFRKLYPQFPVSDDYCISYPDLSDDAKNMVNAIFGKNFNERGNYLQLPPELKCDVYPSQLPPELKHVYFRRTDGLAGAEWQRVDPRVSSLLTPPRDPILVSNERFFATVWPAVEKALGVLLPVRSEVKNEYGGAEPWYRFMLNGATFTVGWRKRVINIEVTSPNPIPAAEILGLAVRDNTSYWANGEWNSPNLEVESVTIHAWGQAKLIEYLTVLCKIVLELA